MSKTWKSKYRTKTNGAKIAISQQRAQEAESEIETAHRAFSQRAYLNVYVYDRTEDGPEVDIITAILAGHSDHNMRGERARI